MPYIKRNKQQVKKCQDKIIKMRLMQISICVDNYIYKHKPITVEDAKTYAHEISHYKTQCNGDIHILQVIEKLTRCMKSIVEETTKNLSSSLNNTDSEKTENINVELSMNTHLENNIMAKNDKNGHEMLATKNTLNKNAKPTPFVFVGCENMNEIIDANKVLLNNETQSYDVNTIISKCPNSDGGSENKNPETTEKNNNPNFKSCIDSIVEPKIVTKNILDKGKLNIIINEEKLPLKIFETPISLFAEDHLRSGYEDVSHTQQLKVCSSKTNVNVTTQPLYHIRGENKEQKNIIKTTQTPTYSVNTAKKEKKKSARVKLASENRKKCVTKNKSDKENISNKTQSRKKPNIISGNNTTSNNFKIPNQCKHTNVHIKNNEVSITACDENRSDTIISHDNSLKYNKCAVNDLSWIKDIRYVREVSSNEFDPKLNDLEDNFWDNFSFPEGWADIEFHY